MSAPNAPRYPLDSSAIVHLGSRNRYYTNAFRLSAVLTEPADPAALQTALDRITPRFPTIVAGIRRGAFQYWVVPSETPPAVERDAACLAVMSRQMLRRCAMRVLYSGNRVSVELFHSLTDGCGGLAFLRALLTEYCALRQKSSGEAAAVQPPAGPSNAEWADDYLTYAAGPAVSLDRRPARRLPGGGARGQPVQTVTGEYDLQELLALAHRYGVHLTALLAALMAQAIRDVPGLRASRERPIRMMVPANMRAKFPSKSLRNFSLYALPTVEPAEWDLPLPALVKHIDRQLQQQLAPARLTGMMYTSTWLQTVPAARCMPLVMKEAILRVGCSLFGERSSCLTLSNLGEAGMPPAVRPYVQRVELALTPRRDAPYNCGVLSYHGRLYITFSCRGGENALPQQFFRRLANQKEQVESDCC